MKKVMIKNLSGIQTHGAEMEDPSEWLEKGKALNWWGLPGEYTIEIIDISAELALKKCFAQRKAEYPSAEDFLNAYFDGNEADMDRLKAQRLQVKAKYPKPTLG